MTQRSPARPGLTLVELLVALNLLVVGVLALAGTTAALQRAESAARRSAEAAAVIAARVETFGAGGCRDGAGARAAGELAESWRAWTDDSLHWLADTVRLNARPVLSLVAVVGCLR